MRKMKGYQLIILLLILALMACGCQKQEASSGEGINESSELDSEPEAQTGTVTVYYVSQPDEIRTMFSLTKEALPEEIVLDIHEFSSYAEMETEIQNSGMPDLLVLDIGYLSGSLNIRTMTEDGKLLDLRPWVEQEKNAGLLQEEQYFHGVFDAGEVGGKLVYLPVSVSTYFGVTTFDKIESSGLKEISQGGHVRANLSDLVDTLLMEQNRLNETYRMVTWPTMIMAPTLEILYTEILSETGVLKKDPVSGEIQADEAGLAKMGEYFSLLKQDIEAAGTIKNSDRMDTLDDAYLMATPNLNLPHQARYWQSAYRDLLDKETSLVFFPDMADLDRYGASANIAGLISSESEVPGAAYQVLRALMEIPARTWIGITIGDFANIIGPVSRKVFEEELTLLTEDYGAKYKINAQTFTRMPLDEEVKAQLEDWALKVQIRPIADQDLIEYVKQKIK